MLAHEAITERVIGAFYEVYNGLGTGFLEKVYENALVIELNQRGLQAEQQQRIPVHYRGELVGEYFADIVIEDLVIVELKIAKKITNVHIGQLINYLKATHCEVGFVLNFGPEAMFERRFAGNDKKPHLKRNSRQSV
jgi:GxxExxY protein